MRNLFRLLLLSACLLCCSIGSVCLAQQRDKVVTTFTSQIGVREATGHNDGVMVETYLRYCSLAKGNPWCASFVCWTFGQAQVSNPRSGYCPDLFRPAHVIYKRTIHTTQKTPQPGDVWGLYFPEKGRIAHVGFVSQWGDKYIITVEGNTNEAGSREGDGVYRKRRPRSSIYMVAKYIKD